MSRVLLNLIAVLVTIAATCSTAAELLLNKAPPMLSHVWIGPMPFKESRILRDDWFPTLTEPSKWQVVLKNAEVFKSYILVLSDIPPPGKTAPELSNMQISQLVRFARDHKLKVAFEVGGLRTSTEVCGDQAGETFARHDLSLLTRWLSEGGRIDYLTTDHAVMMNMRGVGFPGPGLNPDRACKMTLQDLINELADYFQVIHKRIPNARLGVIEALGYFHVLGPNGQEYPHTDSMLPVWKFADFFDHLLLAMKERNLQLDHFHLDFGFDGVDYDGRSEGKLNFGRVLAVEAYVRSKGVKAGLIFNAFHDRKIKNPERDTASREAYQRTLRYFSEYIKAGGKADQMVLQTWHPYPDRTGPEDEPFTVLNIARDVIEAAPHTRMRNPK